MCLTYNFFLGRLSGWLKWKQITGNQKGDEASLGKGMNTLVEENFVILIFILKK